MSGTLDDLLGLKQFSVNSVIKAQRQAINIVCPGATIADVNVDGVMTTVITIPSAPVENGGDLLVFSPDLTLPTGGNVYATETALWLARAAIPGPVRIRCIAAAGCTFAAAHDWLNVALESDVATTVTFAAGAYATNFAGASMTRIVTADTTSPMLLPPASGVAVYSDCSVQSSGAGGAIGTTTGAQIFFDGSCSLLVGSGPAISAAGNTSIHANGEFFAGDNTLAVASAKTLSINLSSPVSTISATQTGVVGSLVVNRPTAAQVGAVATGGDVSAAGVVTAIQAVPVDLTTTPPTTGQVLGFDGTSIVPVTSGGALSTYYTPDIAGPIGIGTGWTDLGAATCGTASAKIRVGGVWYAYGDYNNGSPTAAIRTSTDGINWTVDGTHTMPYTGYGWYIAVIGNAIWFCGSGSNSANILRAALSDPLTVIDTGHSLTHDRGGTCHIVTPTNIVIPCGHSNSVGGLSDCAIATIADPTTWTTSIGMVLGYGSSGAWQVGVFLTGRGITMFGDYDTSYAKNIVGIASNGQITPGGGVLLPQLPYNITNSGVALHIGNHIVVPVTAIGTNDAALFDAETGAFVALQENCMPAAVDVSPTQYWVLSDGTMMCYDYNGGSPRVLRSSRIRLTGPAQAAGSVAPIQCWTDNGQPVLLTTTVQRGWPEQWCCHCAAI